MVFSVWDWNQQQYAVFESASGERPGQRPEAAKKVNDPRGRGRQLETLLPVLPKDAVQKEMSVYPKGRIALHWSSSAVGLGDDASPFVTSPWLTLGLIVGGVWIGHRLLVAVARRM